MLHVYYGYGKGKTTAAMGLALRALGYDKKIIIVQFLKNIKSGEVASFEKIPNVTFLLGQANNKFTNIMNEIELNETRKIHNQNLSKAINDVKKSNCDMLVLDEVLDAYSLNLLDKKIFEQFIKNLPSNVEVILTGHVEIDWINEIADYLTHMDCIKHPYQKGISARKSVEY